MPDPFPYDVAREAICKIAAEHGKAAASWVFDGNTDPSVYVLARAVLDGTDDSIEGEAWRDRLPHADLSGEMADGPTPDSLLRDIGLDDSEQVGDWTDDLMTSYEEAFAEAVQQEVYETARYHTS